MIGDTLAKGALSAQFAGASSNISDFENDVIYMEVEEVLTKYGISQADYDMYQVMREEGKHLPDLTPKVLQDTLEVGFSITDHRKNYLSESTEAPRVAQEAPKKYPESTYGPFSPLMDRVLVMRIMDDPDMELLEDGSTRSKRTGLVTAAKYRQHSNVGIVLATGQWVVMGGVKFPMSDFVKPLDKVMFGSYNAEAFPMDSKKAEALCDSIGVNYAHEDNLWIVRVQDIRGAEKPDAV